MKVLDVYLRNSILPISNESLIPVLDINAIKIYSYVYHKSAYIKVKEIYLANNNFYRKRIFNEYTKITMEMEI